MAAIIIGPIEPTVGLPKQRDNLRPRQADNAVEYVASHSGARIIRCSGGPSLGIEWPIIKRVKPRRNEAKDRNHHSNGRNYTQ
jgi:hypothetical protein